MNYGELLEPEGAGKHGRGTYTAWVLLAGAGLTCAAPLASWRYDDFIPEHTIEIGYSPNIPTGTKSAITSTASTTYASVAAYYVDLWGVRFLVQGNEEGLR